MNHNQKDRLKYIDKGEGEIILFFHGWGLSTYSYKEFIESLSRKFRVIAPVINNFRDFEKNIKLISQIVGNKKVIVIGHSAGGLIAAEFASKNPDKVRGLFLLDSLGAVEDKSIIKWRINWLKESLGILIHPNSVTTLIVKDFFSQFYKLLSLIKDANFILKKNILLKPNFPVIILWGKRDKLVSIQNGLKLQKSIQGAVLKEMSGNHYWFLENPPFLIKEIEEFTR